MNWSLWGHEGLGRIHRKSRSRMHYALLGAAGAEDHSREANSRNLPHHTSCLHYRPRVVVNLWNPADQLASHDLQRGDACICPADPGSESALPVTAILKKQYRPP